MATGYKTMHIKITRIEVTDKGIFGHLDVDGFSCVTLEPDDLNIPAGSYRATLYNSPANKTLVPLLHDVPGRSMIEIHCGNWEKDSKGCILVGMKRNGYAIESSRQAFKLLMAKLLGAEDIRVTVI
jgi:hypothetical protein